MGADILYAGAFVTVTEDGASESLPTENVRSLRLDYDVTALTGGTAPTITFGIQVLDGTGAWRSAFNGSAVASPSAAGPSVGANTLNPLTLTKACRVIWTLGGTVVPDSVSFSVSLIGRS